MSFHPLCPELYDALLRSFGAVRVSNEGVAIDFQEVPDPSFPFVNGVPTRTNTIFLENGETYMVCCPSCGDSRFRLAVPYRVFDFPWRLHCFNEPGRCYTTDTDRRWFLHSLMRNRSGTIRQPPTEPGHHSTEELRVAALPGHCLSLAELSASHPAVRYLRGRYFDPIQLHQQYGLRYCHSSAEFPKATGRIILPIVVHNRLVGWQGRFPGERDWKICGVPKYYNLPRMPKGLMLYGFDQLRADPPFGILFEGCTSVWRMPGLSVATLGKQLSTPQRGLLAQKFPNKPLGLFFDNDADDEADRCLQALRSTHKAPVIRLRAPEDSDAGLFVPQVLRHLIDAQFRREGITLEWPS